MLTGVGEKALTFTWRIKRLGRISAWMAAYALVLNVMLTSALLASISPIKFNALHELCLNGSSGVPTAEDESDAAKPVIRCPLCVSGVAAINLPPQSAAQAIRIALHVLFEPAQPDTIIPRLVAGDHRPRGPPKLS
jgi:hypothetical protein